MHPSIIRSRIAQQVVLMSGSALLAVANVSFAGEPFNVQREIPMAEKNDIESEIKNECTELGTKLSGFLVKYAGKKGITVNQVDSIDPSAPGRNLVIEITDAVSHGNAWSGHLKAMDAKAELFVDGKSVGTKDYQRESMGGFGAGFKGSCSVLGRTSKALGKDFSKWLEQMETMELE
jgi:hypothetical protein